MPTPPSTAKSFAHSQTAVSDKEDTIVRTKGSISTPKFIHPKTPATPLSQGSNNGGQSINRLTMNKTGTRGPANSASLMQVSTTSHTLSTIYALCSHCTCTNLRIDRALTRLPSPVSDTLVEYPWRKERRRTKTPVLPENEGTLIKARMLLTVRLATSDGTTSTGEEISPWSDAHRNVMRELMQDAWTDARNRSPLGNRERIHKAPCPGAARRVRPSYSNKDRRAT
jgi:hypothetical protein